MKFNVLRAMLIPWILFFFITIALFVVVSLHLPAQAQDPRFVFGALGLGILTCLYANFETLNKAGIWVAYSLPYTVRHKPLLWVLSGVVAICFAGGIYAIGEISWMPLFWQGFVIPIVFAGALFVFIRSLAGLILKQAASVSFIRLFVVTMNLPILVLVAVSAVFLSQGIVRAYEQSQPEVAMVRESQKVVQAEKPAPTKPAPAEEKLPEGVSRRAHEFRELAENNQPCVEQNKEVRNSLDPNGPEEVVFWAIKALKCTDMKGVVILPRLVDLMIKHKSAKVRAASIEVMSRYNAESVRSISYLLVKRLNDHDPEEVVQAAATILSKLGETERAQATNRMKSLLDLPATHQMAAHILIDTLKQGELVANYVTQNLKSTGESRQRAIALICQLPPNERTQVEAYVSDVTAAIQKPVSADPAMKALNCLGPIGLQAIRNEVLQPQKLGRPVAARALAEMDLKNDSETLKAVENCLHDGDQEVRKSCSQSMGKVGKLALPEILDLLKSKDPSLRESGQRALEAFNDPLAKEELRKVRAENSGWMANQGKLKLANAVSGALRRIEHDEKAAATTEKSAKE